MGYWDLNGLAWQQLGNAIWDVFAVLWWMFVACLAAAGGCWCVGQFMYGEWVREHPPPRPRFFAERRLRRDLARGLADIGDYLTERDPAHVIDKPPRPNRSRTRSRQGWHRP